MKEMMTREKAEKIVKILTDEQREAVAFIVETTEEQGDYAFDGEGSYWEAGGAASLTEAAKIIRGMK